MNTLYNNCNDVVIVKVMAKIMTMIVIMIDNHSSDDHNENQDTVVRVIPPITFCLVTIY